MRNAPFTLPAMVCPRGFVVLASPTEPRAPGELLDLISVGVVLIRFLNVRLEWNSPARVCEMDVPKLVAHLLDRLLHIGGNSTGAWLLGCYRLGVRQMRAGRSSDSLEWEQELE